MTNNVKKAVFPVGGMGTRFLPATKALPKEMLPIVDKPLIQYAVEEAASAGIEEFIFVTGRGKTAIEDHFDQSNELVNLLRKRNKDKELNKIINSMPKPGAFAYTRQQEPLGLGHAIWCARNLIGDNTFAVLLADDIFMSRKSCLKQMIDQYDGEGGMVAVEEIEGEEISSYGVLDVDYKELDKIKIKGLVEKPIFNQAPSKYAVVGRYILTPKIFEYLDRQTKGAGDEIQLTDALSWTAKHEDYYGLKIDGERFDCGSKIGYLRANIAFGIDRGDLSDEILNYLRTFI
ncbi:MAG: UTP--glucose-1-phosphate uridylyltransferase [Alphaproteobacteria bacterium MarineAlpha2_Bin1]|nr:MAG: UTP--glucose-1-phosphate uridylyltransferase [Alphaproteobacteria bacterium MarineAlpha2_Bin1]